MRVPLSWLREHVDWDLELEALANRLTLGGLEVAAIDRVGEEWDPETIFVGEVLSVDEHPNADRLVLATVDYGAEEPMQVVTGAPNLPVGESGQKVVFATEGARLINGYADELEYITLKKTKIRGVVSAGMVCSEKELGISDEHTGILILPDDAPAGKPFADYWGDVVLDLDLTPNLARCFSVTGVARETAALVGSEFEMPDYRVKATGKGVEGQIDISIEDPDLCPRYSAAIIRDVRIGPSPSWMQRRLHLAGMRPINNIVDVTNYVMLELGQPLHAFDLNRLRACEPGGPPAIIVRRAKPGERMLTLDGQERTFSGDMLLITDGGGPVGVAGVMGGFESEIGEDTVDILLEAASFDNISVRRTSAGLKIPSEAASRFGRGVDPELTLVALRRASELMRLLADGEVAQGFADVYPRPWKPQTIDLPASEVERLLGISLDAERIAEMLEALGFGCQVVDSPESFVRTTVPSFRLDVDIPADLVEDVARIYGYDRLPSTMIGDPLPTQRRDRDLDLEEQVRDLLVGCGLNEIITYSLTNLDSVAKLDPEGGRPHPEDYLRLANPLSVEQEYLRRTLMNTTLTTMAQNLRFVDRVALFEIAHVYLPEEGELLPEEPRRLSIGLCGGREPRSWLDDDLPEYDFYDLKGIIETITARLGVEGLSFAPCEHATMQPGRTAGIWLGDDRIGTMGEVHPLVCESFDLEERRVALLELDLEALLAAAHPVRPFAAISAMPLVKLDLALVVDESVPSDAIARAMCEVGGELLRNVQVFDVYRGAQLGEGKKSLAYRLAFQATDRTLTSEEANAQRDAIVARLEEMFGAEIRA